MDEIEYTPRMRALMAELEGWEKPPPQGGVLLSSLIRAGAALQGLLEVELRQVGLTPLEVEVLRRLSAQPGSSEALLAEKLWMKRQSVHRVVARLRAAGLIDAEPSESDRRTVCLWLTPLARERLSTTFERLDRLESRILGELTEDDRAALLERLERATLGLRKEEEHKLWALISRRYG